MDKSTTAKLFTSSYLFTFMSNFLMFFAFYMLLPVLPMYLTDQFGAGKSLVGAILASYTITALIIRPFAGFLVDMFQRKPLFLLAYTLFIAYFAGYMVAGTVMVFAILRATHGLAFGLVTISSSTVAVDIMPASRRNEGIGYFGLSMNIAMAIGPMTALYIFDTTGNYDYIFGGALLSGLIGLCCIFFIHTPHKEKIQHEAISFDRFFLIKGLPGAINLALLSFSYGILSTYVAVYGSEEVGIKSGTGLFFVAMAAGLIISRVISGKMMNRGELNKVIESGIIIMFLSYIVFIFLKSALGFYLSAIFLGFAYGFVCPAFQAMFISLAQHNQRGTANSTYFIAWDLGIGTGVLLGGQIADISSYTSAYICGLILVVLGYMLFKSVTAKYYLQNKLY
ncbi:MAG: MFS transporter [Bacteroidales bacterium]